MPAPDPVLRVTLPSDTRYLHVVTNLARNAARAGGLSEGDADKLALATDEAVTNVIEHAYGGASDRSIEILVLMREDGVEIHVIHDGKPINEASLPKEFDPRDMIRRGKKGGMGVILMRRLVDRVDFRATSDQRNECCLWKGKSAARSAPDAGGSRAAGA